MVASLKRGDEIITSGGIIGRVDKISGNDKADITIAENVTVEVVRGTGIQSLMNSQEIKK